MPKACKWSSITWPNVQSSRTRRRWRGRPSASSRSVDAEPLGVASPALFAVGGHFDASPATTGLSQKSIWTHSEALIVLTPLYLYQKVEKFLSLTLIVSVVRFTLFQVTIWWFGVARKEYNSKAEQIHSDAMYCFASVL